MHDANDHIYNHYICIDHHTSGHRTLVDFVRSIQFETTKSSSTTIHVGVVYMCVCVLYVWVNIKGH